MIARDLLLSLAAPLLALPAASALAAWSRRARVDLDPETHASLAFALVLAWLQAGGMVLGATGMLHALPATAWIAAGVAAAIGVARKITVPALRPAHALFLLPIAGYLLLGTVPPWQRDELVYHLALPRAFALAGRYVQPDDNVFASLPLGWESAVSLLYAIGRGGEPLFDPHLLTAWTSGAAALAAAGLARSLGARSPWIAGAALLAVPTFVEFGSSGYVEAYLLLLITLSLACVAKVVTEDGASPWLLPGAALAGVAASVKYTGLAALAFLALSLLVHRPPSEPAARERFLAVPENVRRAARFAAIALLVASPFYVRNAIQRGNPFFPLAFDLFGGRGWDALRAEAYWETLRGYGGGSGLADTLALPLRIFAARDMDRGLEGSIGPVAGAGIVTAIVLLRRPSPARRAVIACALFALAWFLFWAFTVQQARFFLPAVPPLLALLAAGLSLAPGRWPGALAVAASLGWGAGIYGTLWSRQYTSAWLSGTMDKDALLDRLLPESYPAMREIGARVPPSGKVWLVWTRGYTYYLDRPYRLDSVFEGWRFEALLDASPDPAAFAASLRAEGFTHVLVNRRFFLQGTSAETEPGRTARLRERFAAVLASGALVEEKDFRAVSLLRVAGPGA